MFRHASWTDRRADSYDRLAFLGDSVLALAVTTFLYPRLEAERYGAGRLTKIRAQAVSGGLPRASPSAWASRSGCAAAAPEGASEQETAQIETERVLASVIEAVIGACYLHTGYERTSEAAVEAFLPEIEEALEHPVDFKSALQELLAQRGEFVRYVVSAELGPPHDRTFEVQATVGDRVVGEGSGRSKKHGEQEAARVALLEIEEAGEAARSRATGGSPAPSGRGAGSPAEHFT